MSGVRPPTKTGGHDDFRKKMQKDTASLGKWMGRGIYALMAIVLFIEFVLNPIFMIAQARDNGVDIDPDPTSFLWWVRVIMLLLVTFATSGVQWALLSPERRKGGIGYYAGWGIAIADTAMDGGGFLAIIYGSDSLTDISFEQSDLRFGLLPSGGVEDWIGWGLICAVCLGNEPFMTTVLGRLTFKIRGSTLPYAKEVSEYTEKTGRHYNKVKAFAIKFAPLNMIAMDLVLFPLAVAQESSVKVLFWSIFSVLVTLAAIALWEFFNHLREVGGEKYKITQLTRGLKLLALGAMTFVILDGYADLRGFNEVLFGESTLLPPMDGVAALLTAGLVMTMCTACEPMIGDIFAPLGAMGMLPDSDDESGSDGSGGAIPMPPGPSGY